MKEDFNILKNNLWPFFAFKTQASPCAVHEKYFSRQINYPFIFSLTSHALIKSFFSTVNNNDNEPTVIFWGWLSEGAATWNEWELSTIKKWWQTMPISIVSACKKKTTIWPLLVFEMSVWLFLYLELSNVGENLVFLAFTESSSIEISISCVMLDNNGSYVNIHKLPKLNYLSGDSEIEKGK